jgi:hypothetical protein
VSLVSVALGPQRGDASHVVAGDLAVLVIGLGPVRLDPVFGPAAEIDVDLSDGTYLEVALTDGSGPDAPRLGSAETSYFVASGARVLVECSIPDTDEIRPSIQLRSFDPARRFQSTAVGTMELPPIPVRRVSSARGIPLPDGLRQPTPEVMLGSSGTYDLTVTASGSGSGFTLTRSVPGIDHRKEPGDFPISQEVLSAQLETLKQRLDAESKKYERSRLENSEDPLVLDEGRAREHCLAIAQVGHEIYKDILWSGLSRRSNDHRATIWKEIERLAPGAHLQIHNDGLVIPWSIVYDGELPATADEFTPEHAKGFWGYRFRISETLPISSTNRVRGQSAPRRDLCAYIDPTLFADKPRLSGIAAIHRTELRAIVEKVVSSLSLLPDETTPPAANPAQMLQLAMSPPRSVHLLYFLCHAKSSRTFVRGMPQLRRGELGLTSAIAITDDDIRSWSDAWGDDYDAEPVVFLNCCEAAQMDPFGFSGLVEGFLTYILAAAVVGCSWEVPAHFAHGFAKRFFAQFLGPEASPLGDALYTIRRELLDTLNPFGLVYAVYGNSAVVVTQP